MSNLKYTGRQLFFIWSEYIVCRKLIHSVKAMTIRVGMPSETDCTAVRSGSFHCTMLPKFHVTKKIEMIY